MYEHIGFSSAAVPPRPRRAPDDGAPASVFQHARGRGPTSPVAQSVVWAYRSYQDGDACGPPAPPQCIHL